jgi:hypothetical protein
MSAYLPTSSEPITLSAKSCQAATADCLDEAGHQATVADVERLRSGADPALDIRAIPDRDDAAIGHRERLRGGVQIVDGENGPGNDQVSG